MGRATLSLAVNYSNSVLKRQTPSQDSIAAKRPEQDLVICNNKAPHHVIQTLSQLQAHNVRR